MTFEPPPPPPPQGPPPGGPPPGGYGGQPPAGYGGPPPGGPPPGQWGPPPGAPGGPYGGGSKPSFDPKSVNPLDWGILGAGALAFIFSFVSYYTYSGKGSAFSSYSFDSSAWSGFFGWFAMLLALIGSAAVAMSIFAPQVKFPAPNRLIGLGAYALATLCVLLALLVVPDYLGGGPGYDSEVDEGHGFGYWVSLIVIIAGLVLSFLRFQQAGGQLPAGMAGLPGMGGGSGGHRGGPGGQPQGGPPQGYQGGPPQGYQGPPPGYQGGPPQGGYPGGPPPSGPPQGGPGGPPPSGPPSR